MSNISEPPPHHLWQSFSLLYRYPAFGRLLAGRLVSLFGDAFALIALPWFVLKVTGSGIATAGILLTLQLPAIITSMALGFLIDRFQPRLIITLDNAIRTLIIGLIPILYWLGLLELWLLFLLAFLAGMLAPATELGSRSFLPELVEDKDLDAANMLWSFSLNLSLVIGPAVAGVLIASFGGPSVLLIDAGTFAVMALAAATLPMLKRSKPPAQAPFSEQFGFHQLWNMVAGMYLSFVGGLHVRTLYPAGDDLAAAQRSQGTTRQGLWGAVTLAHRWLAAWIGCRWHTAGFCPFKQRDCIFCHRLYCCGCRRTCIADTPQLIVCSGRLRRLNGTLPLNEIPDHRTHPLL